MTELVKNCSICSHERLAEIEQAAAAGQSLRQIAAEFGVGRQSLVRHARHGEATQGKKPDAVLTPRQAQLVTELAKPQTVMQSMLNAGYSESSARMGIAGAGSKEVQKVLRGLIQQQIPMSRVALRISEGMDAKQFKFFTHEGKIVDRVAVPDYGERRAYVELACKLGGYIDTKNTVTETTAIEITHEPAAVTDKLLGRLKIIAARSKTES